MPNEWTHEDIIKIITDIQEISGDDKAGYLEYDIMATEMYFKKKEKKAFRIVKLKCADRTKIKDLFTESNKMSKKPSAQMYLYFPEEGSHFEKRLILAVQLAEFVLELLLFRYERKESSGDYRMLSPKDICHIAYYTQTLLVSRTNLYGENVDVRKEYEGIPSRIPNLVKEYCKMYYGNYDEGLLNDNDKIRLRGILDIIHKMIPDNGLLDRDTRLISLYISKKIGSYYEIERNTSEVPCKVGRIVFYDYGCGIWYHKDISITAKRYIMAHELMHAVCHREAKRKNMDAETLSERREATYGARHILEYQLALYCDGDRACDKFNTAKKEFAEIIKEMYKMQNEEFFNWVLA